MVKSINIQLVKKKNLSNAILLPHPLAYILALVEYND